MKLLLLGATGRTGRLVLQHALERGHEVVALVRDPGRLDVRSPALTLVSGTPEKLADVQRAMAGCQAVVVALNNNRTSDMPWAKPVSPPRLIETAMRHCVTAMASEGIRRIVILSASGVGDSFAASPWVLRVLIRKTNLGHTYRDHDAVDAYIRTTNVDWTLVRAVGLTNATKDKTLVVTDGTHPKPGMTISRSQVARFMLDSLQSPAFVKKTPVISER